MLCETIRLALLSVRRNVLRSFLTLLGIVIGVAAVIAMITIGSGTTEKVKTDISKLGSNLLVVRAGTAGRARASTSARRRAQLDDKDVAALVARPDRRQRHLGRLAKAGARRLRHRKPDGRRHRHRHRLFRGARLEGRVGPRLHRIGGAQRRRRLPARRDGAPAVLRRRRPRGLDDPRRQDELPGDRPARAQGHFRLRPGPGQCRADAAHRLPAPHRRQPRRRDDLCRRPTIRRRPRCVQTRIEDILRAVAPHRARPRRRFLGARHDADRRRHGQRHRRR